VILLREALMSTTQKARRVAFLTTAAIVSFSLALLGCGIAMLSDALPLRSMAAADRTDIGSMLLASPILILILALIFEATRIALRTAPLPEPQPIGRLAPLSNRWHE
jgi:hypothetical protein